MNILCKKINPQWSAWEVNQWLMPSRPSHFQGYPPVHLSTYRPTDQSVWLYNGYIYIYTHIFFIYQSILDCLSIHPPIDRSIYLSVCWSTCLPTYLSPYLSPYLFIYLRIYLYPLYPYLSIHLPVCLSVYLSVCLSVCLSICYLSTCLSVYLPIYLIIYLFIYLFAYLPICLSICLSIYLSICPSINIHIHAHHWYIVLSYLETPYLRWSHFASEELPLRGTPGRSGVDSGWFP